MLSLLWTTTTYKLGEYKTFTLKRSATGEHYLLMVRAHEYILKYK